MKKYFIFCLAVLLSTTAFSQTVEKLGKRCNGCEYYVADMQAVRADNLELTISKNGNNINATARGVRSQGVKGCDNCNVSGKIAFTGGAEEAFVPKGATNRTTDGGAQTTAVGVVGVKVVLGKDPGGQPLKTTTLNADGSFSFTGVPKGTYQLKLGDEVIATGWKIGGE